MFNIYIAIKYKFNYKKLNINTKNWTGINNDNGIFLIGSILKYCGNKCDILGVGFKYASEINDIKNLLSNRIYYVRGKKTKDVIINNAKYKDNQNNIKIFEPGLLLYDFRRNYFSDGSKLLIIPHNSESNFINSLEGINIMPLLFSDENYDIILNSNNKEKIIKIFDEKFDVIDKSDIILSSSLHGLCFAIALNKKFIWYTTEFNSENSFKYMDFFSYFNIEPKCLNLNNFIINNKINFDDNLKKYINYINIQKYDSEINNFKKFLLKKI